MPRPDTLSIAEARRAVLAHQGLAADRPQSKPSAQAIAAQLERLSLLQIDSVNVLVRSHYLPLFSRLGTYDPADLDGLAVGKRRKTFEYWGHEASLLPVDLQPLFRWRMEDARTGRDCYAQLHRFATERRDYVARVLCEIRDRGPLGAGALTEGGKASGGWWGWSDGKHAVEWLFWTGDLTTHERRNFERIYDLTERALPTRVATAPTPSREEAQRALLRRALNALGVATERDLRDYFRMPVAETRARLADLVEAGEALPVQVEGWKDIAYRPPKLLLPRRVDATAVLTPFDSLVFERRRTERLFGFRYRIELYTPERKRTYGYYVLPFLMGDRLVARVDLKADRAKGRLLAAGVFAEPAADPGAVAPALAEELNRLARWLGLERVVVGRRGDLSTPLRHALAAANRRVV
ncbi:MAG: crosslink repair DNA glycosylase YcaQ family protein [Hyphomicrobiaceae bacterium]